MAHRSPYPPRVWLIRVMFGLVGAVCLAGLSGCGLPTWSELTGGKQQPDAGPGATVQTSAPATPAPPPPPPIVPERPPEPPKPDPLMIVGEFQQRKSYELDDFMLMRVLALDEGLEVITELDLKGSQVTDRGLENLGKLTHLARLDMRNTEKLTKQAYQHVATVGSLEELHVDGNKIDDAGMIALRPLTELRRLHLRYARLSPAGYAELVHHPKLVELELRDSNADDEAMNFVANLPELEQLWLARTRITDVGLARLGSLPRLEALELTDCQITGQGLKGFRSLHTLILANTLLNEQGALAVKSMTQLKVLGLSHLGSMQDVHLFQMVRTLSALEDLNVSFCPQLTSECMQAVKNHKNLRKIDLGHDPKVDDRVLNYLITCKNLKEVNLSGTSCSHVAIERFRGLMPECTVHFVQ